MSESNDAASYVSKQVEASRLFFLMQAEDEDISVVFGGYERCDADYRIDRRNFPWHCLEFVSRGSGKVTLDGIEHQLKPGSCFLYGPGLPHRIESSADHPLGKYFVGFTGKGVADFLERYGIVPGFVSTCLKGEPVRRTFDALIDAGVRKSRLGSPICSLITRQLLLMCGGDAPAQADTGSPAYGTYSRVRDFIERNFLDLGTLEAVSQACKVDAPYICRLFARYHDESPYQFLTRLRMEHASRLLLDGEATVKSVAASMGFKDAFHFSRVFKAVHHVPPSRFRQSMHPQWPG